MINFKPGMFLEFDKTVAKITKVYKDDLVIYKASYGRTDNGYIFQQGVTKRHLRKLIEQNRCKIIPSEDVLMILFRKLKEKK